MAKKIGVKIGKKKKWFDIALPAILRGDVFSQGFCEEPENMIGRTLKVSLGEAISSPMKRHINLTLKVSGIKTSVGQTEIKALSVNPAYLLRKSRKNSKINVKVSGKSADEAKIDIKFAIITNGHCISTAKSMMRKILADYLMKIIKDSKKDAIIIGIINNSVQANIKKSLHKIYPVRSVELEKVAVL